MAAALNFSLLRLYSFDKGNPQQIQLPSNKALKIESIGIAGTKGTIYLQDNSITPKNLAILFTTIDESDYGAAMPFWLPPGFNGWIYNDSGYMCAVSATEYDFVA